MARTCGAISPVRPVGRELADHGGVDVDGEQVRPDLVVQVARQVGPLLVLEPGQLVLERPVPGLHRGKIGRHPVESAREPGDLRGPALLDAHAIVARAHAAETRRERLQRSKRAADGQVDQAEGAHAGERDHRQHSRRTAPSRRRHRLPAPTSAGSLHRPGSATGAGSSRRPGRIEQRRGTSRARRGRLRTGRDATTTRPSGPSKAPPHGGCRRRWRSAAAVRSAARSGGGGSRRRSRSVWRPPSIAAVSSSRSDWPACQPARKAPIARLTASTRPTAISTRARRHMRGLHLSRRLSARDRAISGRIPARIRKRLHRPWRLAG